MNATAVNRLLYAIKHRYRIDPPFLYRARVFFCTLLFFRNYVYINYHRIFCIGRDLAKIIPMCIENFNARRSDSINSLRDRFYRSAAFGGFSGPHVYLVYCVQTLIARNRKKKFHSLDLLVLESTEFLLV